jgi:hypothetical protein
LKQVERGGFLPVTRILRTAMWWEALFLVLIVFAALAVFEVVRVIRKASR